MQKETDRDSVEDTGKEGGNESTVLAGGSNAQREDSETLSSQSRPQFFEACTFRKCLHCFVDLRIRIRIGFSSLWLCPSI
ncbi:hypothetical protein CBR_g23497 [Chara braunii]|uniref:Uncharacterized protein n=1 Tax=Chara braunii TaxID=69332 RepID=A0A388L4D7_CHABU|nr:hypothetical protein CBR_g23497 [Chara braunii]|eukprot:GBG77171.1 hypothetical protein CBR_g23497 [Chara braunii]